MLSSFLEIRHNFLFTYPMRSQQCSDFANSFLQGCQILLLWAWLSGNVIANGLSVERDRNRLTGLPYVFMQVGPELPDMFSHANDFGTAQIAKLDAHFPVQLSGAFCYDCKIITCNH